MPDPCGYRPIQQISDRKRADIESRIRQDIRDNGKVDSRWASYNLARVLKSEYQTDLAAYSVGQLKNKLEQMGSCGQHQSSQMAVVGHFNVQDFMQSLSRPPGTATGSVPKKESGNSPQQSKTISSPTAVQKVAILDDFTSHVDSEVAYDPAYDLDLDGQMDFSHGEVTEAIVQAELPTATVKRYSAKTKSSGEFKEGAVNQQLTALASDVENGLQVNALNMSISKDVSYADIRQYGKSLVESFQLRNSLLAKQQDLQHQLEQLPPEAQQDDQQQARFAQLNHQQRSNQRLLDDARC